jgi:hypothetical protein
MQRCSFKYPAYSTVKVNNKNKTLANQMWCTSVIPALGRLRQEDQDLETSWGYSEPCLKQTKHHQIKQCVTSVRT